MKKTMISFLIAIGTVVVVVVARAARVEMSCGAKGERLR